MTWRFPSCAQRGATDAWIQILFCYQVREDPVTFAAALGSSSALQQDCIMLPSCQLPFFFLTIPLPPLPSSISFLLHLRVNRAETLALHCKKDSWPQGSVRILRDCRRRWKVSWLPGVFSAWHSAFWLCPASADWLHCHLSWIRQLQSAGIPINAGTLMRVLTGGIHCSLLFLCFCLLTSQKNEQQPEHCSEHGSLLLTEN